MGRTNQPPRVIGIVGGVGSGKSTAARWLESWGARRFDADAVAKEVLERPDVRRAVVEAFGQGVLDTAGHIDRAELARCVFDGPDAEARRRRLEGLIHPHVRRELEAWLAQEADRDATPLVLDVPLLLEVGWRGLCDLVVFIDAPDHLRQARAAARGLSPEQWRSREASQWPVARKRAEADVVIANDGDRETFRRELRAWWDRIAGSKDGPSRDAPGGK